MSKLPKSQQAKSNTAAVTTIARDQDDANASTELSPEQLDAIAGGRTSAEDFVRGSNEPFGIGAGLNNSAGGGGGGGGLLAHELTHVTNQRPGPKPRP